MMNFGISVISPLELIVILVLVAFTVITIFALVYSTRKRGMEIVLKKPFYKEKPEDIKNKILKEL
jgi:hypothetical protein